ncbi:polysaccharide lyase family 7 protein [Psychromonas sp. SP041]|uniref:polysaccharide lyase family 7 protein n=1 Tax=Psychromonas sp. SP041 TaxID=1365007 RepID=UPI0004159A31|nr:polysaccharide lyase family 7 protein [Psychromonas sp. SP041]
MKKTSLRKSIIVAMSVLSYSAFAADTAPYNYENSWGNTPFQSALDQVKLTSPDGSTKLADASSSDPDLSFDGYVTSDFKVPSGKNYMQITHEGNASSRTEFRHLTEFSSSDANRMQGTIRVSSTSSGLDEVTVLQVHHEDSKNIGAPLMRIAQIVENGTKFYEAKLRLSACDKDSCDAEYDTYRWLDEDGEATVNPKKNRSFYVRVKEGVVKMLLDGERGTLMCANSGEYTASNCSSSEKEHTNSSGDHVIDSDWPDYGFYFKTGAYIQDAGKAVVRYKSLTFHVND